MTETLREVITRRLNEWEKEVLQSDTPKKSLCDIASKGRERPASLFTNKG